MNLGKTLIRLGDVTPPPLSSPDLHVVYITYSTVSALLLRTHHAKDDFCYCFDSLLFYFYTFHYFALCSLLTLFIIQKNILYLSNYSGLSMACWCPKKLMFMSLAQVITCVHPCPMRYNRSPSVYWTQAVWSSDSFYIPPKISGKEASHFYIDKHLNPLPLERRFTLVEAYKIIQLSSWCYGGGWLVCLF